MTGDVFARRILVEANLVTGDHTGAVAIIAHEFDAAVAALTAERDAIQERVRKLRSGLFYDEHDDGEGSGLPFKNLDDCRACGAGILPENRRIADGCPCNSARGVNHGLVPVSTCTCAECDPAQTGSTRYKRDELHISLERQAAQLRAEVVLVAKDRDICRDQRDADRSERDASNLKREEQWK